MADAGAIERADVAIRATLAQADAVVTLRDAHGIAASARLLKLLKIADKQLVMKLAALTKAGKGDKFTAAQAAAYSVQIRLAIERVQEQLSPVIVGSGEHAIKASFEGSKGLIAKLERVYKGVALPPKIAEAMRLEPILHGQKAVLVTRVATSLDRYGDHMGREFAQRIQLGLLSGATLDQMTASLVAHGGPKGVVSLAAREVAPGIVQRIREGHAPEGLFVQQRYWAERIARTETAYAHGGAALETIRQLEGEELEPRKKIVAMFDNRTAPDSIYVHGQIRKPDENFVDGAGRHYLHPPGRPNDREVVIPWFLDWDETPTTKAPDAAVKAGAQELATPVAPAQKTSFRGFSAADVAQLGTQQAKADAAEAKRIANDDTRAAERLKRLQLQTAASQAKPIAQAQRMAEAKANGLEAKANAQGVALHKKFSKLAKLPKPGKPDTGADAELVLWDAMKKTPTAVLKASAISSGDNHKLLPHDIGEKGLKLFEHKKQVINALTAKHGLNAPLSQLKLSAAFPQYMAQLVDEAAQKKPGAAAKLKALFFSDDIAIKKAPTSVQIAALQKKYGHEKKPDPLETHTLKDGGAGYVDVFNATGTKVAYFKTTPGGKYAVSPPAKLEGFKPRTYETQRDAAAYAIKVGQAISALKKSAPKVTATAYAPPKPTAQARFNPRPEATITSKLGPLEPEREAQKQIADFKAYARLSMRDGVHTRGKHAAANVVDRVLENVGLLSESNAWSGDNGGCWYSSSTGAKTALGRVALKDGEHKRDIEAMGEQLRGDHRHPAFDQKNLRDFARAKYAATQAALEERVKRGDVPRGMDADGYVTVYRGINGAQARQLRTMREQGDVVRVDVYSASSWSVKRSAARPFSGRDGVIVRAKVHYSRFISQYEQEHVAMRRFGDGESEWIMAAPDEHIELHHTDIENPDHE